MDSAAEKLNMYEKTTAVLMLLTLCLMLLAGYVRKIDSAAGVLLITKKRIGRE